MKKINKIKLNILMGISFCMLILLAMNAAAAVNAQNPSSSYNIIVTMVNQEPDPAEPGGYVDVRFKFDNEGDEEARAIEVEVLQEYPFSLDPGRDAIQNIGTLQSRQEGDVGAIVKYRLRVAENAVEGENELKIRYRIDGGVWVTPEEFMVDVRTNDAILAVDSVSTGRKSLEPGSTSIIKIKLSNKADSVLKDIKVTLGLGGLPLLPVDSTNEKSIYQIDAKQDYEIGFNILANPDAESGVYPVSLKVAYSDELGNSYFNNGTIGIVIGAKPDLSITLDDSEIYESGKSGEVVVKIVNKGVTGIKLMNMRLIASDNYRILSNSEVYIGNIDSDDYETADFNLFIEKNKEKEIIIPVVVEYKDANNNDFKETVELKLDLYSAADAKKFGLIKGSNKAGLFIVAAIVIVGLFIYRKKMKGRKKKV
jgi:hypothetical protein|tara:strand:- start:1507 stop:2778 length:1272 start_codon:yes stop_codon:yes gene_type:complete